MKQGIVITTATLAITLTAALASPSAAAQPGGDWRAQLTQRTAQMIASQGNDAINRIRSSAFRLIEIELPEPRDAAQHPSTPVDVQAPRNTEE